MRETRRRIEEGALSMPVLYVYGRNDLTVRLQSAIAAVDLIGQTNPDVRLQLLSGCGHMIFLEHAREFARTITDFIDFRSR
jgi:pimeloyl-ACP methyl ester carboxylesterase